MATRGQTEPKEQTGTPTQRQTLGAAAGRLRARHVRRARRFDRSHARDRTDGGAAISFGQVTVAVIAGRERGLLSMVKQTSDVIALLGADVEPDVVGRRGTARMTRSVIRIDSPRRRRTCSPAGSSRRTRCRTSHHLLGGNR
jgi:hypothetical protein